MKRSYLFLAVALALGIAAIFFFPKGAKEKHSVHDEETYIRFCKEVVENPELYRTFRSHPIYSVFQEDFNEESAKRCLAYLEMHYHKLLEKKALVASLDTIGQPLQVGGISYPTIRNLKIAGDIDKYFGSFNDKTIVQIGASDGALCKILKTLHQPARYCIVDIAPSLALAKKTLADWGVHDVEFYTPEEFTAPKTINLVISPFVFAESPREWQKRYLKDIIRHAEAGYLDCRFPLRHFGLKVWQKEQILARLESIGKHPQLIQEEPLTDIDRCFILFNP